MGIKNLREDGNRMMEKIIEFHKKYVDKEKINELTLRMSDIIANAEMTETESGDLVLDAISEMKCNEIQKQIKLELLKGGYSMEEVYG